MSLPKNAKYFKAVFPSSLFGKLVDISKPKRQTESFWKLVEELEGLQVGARQQPRDLESFRESLDSLEFAVHEQAHPSKPIKSVAGYEISDIVGQGAFGKVYLATKEGQRFAVKEIPFEARDPDKIYKEIQTLAKVAAAHEIQHPNVTNYVDAFKKGPSVFIVMEYVEGLTLHEYIRALQERVGATHQDAKVPEDKLTGLLLDLLMVLKYLHKDCGIVHKDLNPSNILITFDFCLKVTDFGLSQDITHGLSREKTFEGTLAYSAPEMIENTSVDQKADIWSLGCVLYELLAFEPPFHSSNPLTLAKLISNCEFDPLPDSKLARIAHSCLVKALQDRPDASEVLLSLIDELVDYNTSLKKGKPAD